MHLKVLIFMCVAKVSQAVSPVSTFSTCGATGAFGPTHDQCVSEYAGSEHVDVFSLRVVEGKQMIAIPFPGVYRFEALGAGGIGSNAGLGARATGEFPLPQGAVIKLLVGQQGEGDEATRSLGGSGASYIARNGQGEPMLVGGGGASTTAGSTVNGINASPNEQGVNASVIGVGYGAGGWNGNGGQSGDANKGGGGAGFKTGGQALNEDATATQAESFRSSGSGGRYGDNSTKVMSGGFGGGGYALESSSGGGGGYSGGGGASDGAVPGGGGSYVSGINTVVDIINSGAGRVTVQFIDTGIDTICLAHSFTVAFYKELVYGETDFTLEDTSCKSTSNETHVIITSRLDECGTRVSFENGSMLHFQNTIKKSSGSEQAVRYQISDINITCSYSASDAVTLNILPQLETANFRPEVEEGDFLISTKAYRTILYEAAFKEEDFPLKVSTEDHIFLEVSLSIVINSPDVVLQLDKCFASPSLNLTLEPKHALIADDCAEDETVEFAASRVATTKRFLFKPVAFPQEDIASAFIHCEASLCQSTDGVKCREGCSRQKRHIVSSDMLTAEDPHYQFHGQVGHVGPFLISENVATRPQATSFIFAVALLSLRALLS